MDSNGIPGTTALIERLKSHWSKSGVKIRPGVSPEQIEEFESRYKVCLPLDLREYFTAVDGMDEEVIDDDGFAFHSLQAVKSVPEELAHFSGIPDYTDIMRTLPDPHTWFVVIDFLISSAVFAIRLSSDAGSTPVRWIGGGTHHHVVAPTFSDVLETYLADPLRLSAGDDTPFWQPE